MNTKEFPVTVTEGGVSAKIRRVSQFKNGKHYTVYIADFIELGKRKQVGRAKFEDARQVALDACRRVSSGDKFGLELRNAELLVYTNAVETLSQHRVQLDTACREYAEALQILGGRASILEACRDWVKRNSVTLPQITVQEAVTKVQERAEFDKKSQARQHELAVLLNRFAGSFQCQVHAVTAGLISAYLTELKLSERSKRNHRDAIGHLNQWLVLHGYLAKGANWMDGVQKYSRRKHGRIEIYTPAELGLILKRAKKWQVPVISIGAFAGLRHSEIRRLDWAQVELSDKPGESYIEVLPVEGTKSDQRRRLVPISENLKTWLRPHVRPSGRVCPVDDSETLLPRLVKRAGVEFKKNALRHSCISYRVSQSGDIARVSYESGNSPGVIQSNYLRRVKPSLATEWFSILPPRIVKTRKPVFT